MSAPGGSVDPGTAGDARLAAEINDRILRELRDGVLVIDDEKTRRHARSRCGSGWGGSRWGNASKKSCPEWTGCWSRRGGERCRFRARRAALPRDGALPRRRVAGVVSDLEEVSREFERNKLASLEPW